MSLLTESRMDRTAFSTVSLFDETDDDAYWHAQTPDARLRALELLRQINSMATTQIPPDFKDFLRPLNDKSVEYLLIGGYAVAYHGYSVRPPDTWLSCCGASRVSGYHSPSIVR